MNSLTPLQRTPAGFFSRIPGRLIYLASATIPQLPRILLLCSALLLAGCAGGPAPRPPFVRTGPTYGTTIRAVDRVGLLSDMLILYDRSGADKPFSVEDSVFACTNMLMDARRHLEKKGYQTAFAQGPFVGACVDSAKPYKISLKRHDAASNSDAPFYLAPEANDDAAYREAVLKALKRAHEAMGDYGELPTEILRAESSTLESFKLIQERTGVRYLLIICGDGKIVSAGKQAGQIIATTILSTLMTGGLTTVTAHNTSFLNSRTGLIDLETGEMLWTNALALKTNPASDGLYRGAWSNALLSDLPSRNAAQR
jgi:hypothetical protein